MLLSAETDFSFKSEGVRITLLLSAETDFSLIVSAETDRLFLNLSAGTDFVSITARGLVRTKGLLDSAVTEASLNGSAERGDDNVCLLVLSVEITGIVLAIVLDELTAIASAKN